MKALGSLIVLATIFLAVAACAQSAPTATPDVPATVEAQIVERLASIPTATAYPTLTPAPTYTLYPTATPRPTATFYPTLKPLPTYTPYPTVTPYPTATPYPTLTPRPTPTNAPTATPYPTYTPYPTFTPIPRPTNTPRPFPTPTPTREAIGWRNVYPFNNFSLRIPYRWQLSWHHSEGPGRGATYSDTEKSARVRIYSGFSMEGWAGLSIERYTNSEIQRYRRSEHYPGFRVISRQNVSTEAARIKARYYSPSSSACGGVIHSLFAVTTFYIYTVQLLVCDHAEEKYDDDFADELLSSFSYQ